MQFYKIKGKIKVVKKLLSHEYNSSGPMEAIWKLCSQICFGCKRSDRENEL